MQISDMMGKYSRNVTNGTEELKTARGTEKLVSTVQDLSVGSVFEGTVNQAKNGKVLLALGNGQTITARLDGKVDITPGASMFFQVKANDGATVSIRPYSGAGSMGNPTLFNALTAAQIPVTERNLRMVDAMMKEQLPIGRQSILDMVKILNNNLGVNVDTAVRMIKLGLPVTPELAAQFEQYQTNSYQVLSKMDAVAGELAAVLGEEGLAAEDAFSLYSKVIDLMLGEPGSLQAEQPGQIPVQGEELLPQPALAQADGQLLDVQAGGQPLDAQANVQSPVVQSPIVQTNGETSAQMQAAAMEGGEQELLLTEQAVAAQQKQSTQGSPQGQAYTPDMGAALGELLSKEQMENLAKSLQGIPSLTGNPEIFAQAETGELFVDTMTGDKTFAESLMQGGEGHVQIRGELTAGDFLKALQGTLSKNSQYGFVGVQRLFSTPEFQTILQHAVTRQWTITPDELKAEGKIVSLYERAEHQIRQMEQAVRASGSTQTNFLQAAADVRGAIEFMNQMNQIYSYIQMPLKLSGQSANGELHVYTNKKRLQDSDGELTAFLHLDLEQLGSTDVSVRLKDRHVTTSFYLSDEASFDLIERHMPILEKRLKSKGYHCTTTISKDKGEANSAKNLLPKQQLSAGMLHRYSFDIRT